MNRPVGGSSSEIHSHPFNMNMNMIRHWIRHHELNFGVLLFVRCLKLFTLYETTQDKAKPLRCNSVSSCFKWEKIRWAGHVARIGEKIKVCKVLVGKPEWKRPLERPRRRWEKGIRMDLRKIGWGGVEWLQLAQDRGRWGVLVNTVINLRALAPRS
jgi:hypothetical protein